LTRSKGATQLRDTTLPNGQPDVVVCSPCRSTAERPTDEAFERGRVRLGFRGDDTMSNRDVRRELVGVSRLRHDNRDS
jgi:hypothetical protein